MQMHKSILFLTLRVFSATGGIEKICKVVCKVLMEMNKINSGQQKLSVLSMYDVQRDVDDKYIAPSFFKGFGQKKIIFSKSAIVQGCRADVVILSHINLLSIGFIIKLCSPKTKLILFAHGIEVWSPLHAFRKAMLKKCDLFITVSQFTKNRMMDLHPIPEEKLVVLNNCIDPYLPPPVNKTAENSFKKKYGFTNEDTVLMTLTRLSSKEMYKGYDNVLYAVSRLKSRYPGIKYLMIGRYDEQEKKRLDNIVKQLSLNGNVVFTGYVQDDDLASHYALADIYVMPSKKEGFGIVFIEAMYYGLPVIAGNKDGSTDALCNGRLGLLVDPDNQEEIDTAIERVILQPDQFIPDHELLMRHFSYAAYKEKLVKVLDEVEG